MRYCALILVYFGVLMNFSAQDKIYFLNGSSKAAKVLEISPESILIEGEDEPVTLKRENLLLILYKNGTVELINTPSQNLIYNPAAPVKFSGTNAERIFKPNHFSVNTLALCNADVAAFYEYITRSKKIGVGVMGAYNFNLKATYQNQYIARLQNAKKNFDVGATVNIYPWAFKKRTTFYFGMMLKYTGFSFDGIKADPVNGGNTVIYFPASGSQLATLFTSGTHTLFGQGFFIKTMLGLGAFKLKGEYKEQFNYELNSAGYDRINYLPKIYFGINLGFNL